MSDFFVNLMFKNRIQLAKEVAKNDPAFQPALKYIVAKNNRANRGEDVVEMLTDQYLYVNDYVGSLSYMPEYTVLLSMYASFLFMLEKKHKKNIPKYLEMMERAIGWEDTDSFSGATLSILVSALWFGDYKGFRGAFNRCQAEQLPISRQNLEKERKFASAERPSGSYLESPLVFEQVAKYLEELNQPGW